MNPSPFSVTAMPTPSAPATAAAGSDQMPDRTEEAAADCGPADVPEAHLYHSGSCNIGPDEIARRRRVGHVGLLASGVLLGGLLATGAPRPARALVALPASLAASGYLQARLRFCAGFGSRGVFNFGRIGEVHQVDDPQDRTRDRARARQIGLASLAAGVAAGVIATALPL